MANLINPFWGAAVEAPTMTLSTTSTSSTWSPDNVTNPGDILFWTVTGGIEIAETEVDDPTFDLTLNSGSADMTVYDVSQLTQFEVNNEDITAIDVTEAVALIDLELYLNPAVTVLDLSGNPDLETLYCYSCNIDSLDISNNLSLNYISAGANGMSTFTAGSNTALATLFLNGNSGLTSVDLSGCTTQIYLNIASCPSLSSLTLGSTLLQQIFILDCDLPNGIDVSGMTGLHRIYCQGNNYTVTATNQLLADLVANGRSVGNERLRYRNNETGQGITDRATLVSRGWTITNFAT